MSSASLDADSYPSSPSTPDNPPLLQQSQSSILSPPDSRSAMPPPNVAGANSNGKRPINTISNGTDDVEHEDTLAAMQASNGAGSAKPRQEFPTRTHERSGYTWSREEDAPGYAWGNKKAVDEFHRAWDALVHKENMVRGRYGDPFEMVENERAMLNSLQQK